jgi:DNA-binding beta-propeller fold protein YncE
MRHDLDARGGLRLAHGPMYRTALLAAAAPMFWACGGGNNGAAPSVDAAITADAEPPPEASSNEAAPPGVDASSPEASPDGSTAGSGRIGTIAKAANDPGFTSPFDATPSPDGSTIYFTAIAADGTGAVFSTTAGASAATRLDSGGVLVAPSGIAISEDGKQLFVADPASDDDMSGAYGAVFVLPSGGGTPTALGGTQGLQPRSVAVAATTLYFTTGAAAAGGPGVRSVPLSGGTPAIVSAGPPFADPSGLAVSHGGDIYVADAVASPNNLGVVVRITGGSASMIVTDLGVGFPAGIALTQDESAVLVSGVDPVSQTDLLYRVDLASPTKTTTFNQTISSFSESAGLHRAAHADVYAWADSRANGTGTVYSLSK